MTHLDPKALEAVARAIYAIEPYGSSVIGDVDWDEIDKYPQAELARERAFAYAREALAALPVPVGDAQDRIDAARWRALMSSQRLHFMGSAGFEHIPKDGDPDNRALANTTPKPRGDRDMHFGMEFWDVAKQDDRFPDTFERELLTVYVDAIRSRALGVTAGQLASEDAFCLSGGARPASPTPAVSREDVIEECAKLIDDVMKAEKPGRAKMMLAIAAKTVRRGRHLTDSEKLANIERAMREAEAEEAANGRA